MALWLGRVGVLEQPGRWRERAGMADADRAACAELGFELARHGCDRPHRRLVGALRRRHAQARALLAGIVEHDALDLGAAEIDADAHAALRTTHSQVLSSRETV